MHEIFLYRKNHKYGNNAELFHYIRLNQNRKNTQPVTDWIRDSSVGIVTRQRAGSIGARFPAGSRNVLFSKTYRRTSVYRCALHHLSCHVLPRCSGVNLVTLPETAHLCFLQHLQLNVELNNQSACGEKHLN